MGSPGHATSVEELRELEILKGLPDWQIAWSATSTADAARLSTGPYWLQTGLIAGYAVLLQVLYWRSGEADSSGSEAPSPVSS